MSTSTSSLFTPRPAIIPLAPTSSLSQKLKRRFSLLHNCYVSFSNICKERTIYPPLKRLISMAFKYCTFGNMMIWNVTIGSQTPEIQFLNGATSFFILQPNVHGGLWEDSSLNQLQIVSGSIFLSIKFYKWY